MSNGIDDFWRDVTRMQRNAGYGNAVSYNPDEKNELKVVDSTIERLKGKNLFTIIDGVKTEIKLSSVTRNSFGKPCIFVYIGGDRRAIDINEDSIIVE